MVFIPSDLGELLTKVDKAFAELVATGLVEAPAGGWRMYGRSRRAVTRSPARRRSAALHAGACDEGIRAGIRLLAATTSAPLALPEIGCPRVALDVRHAGTARR